MDALRKTLLTFGFVRECCRDQNIELFPNVIVNLFVTWLWFYDSFDEDLSHPMLTLECIDDQSHHVHMEEDQDEDEIVFGEWCSTIGQTIINKGDKFTWTFEIYNSLLNCADLQIGIIDNKMLQLDQLVSDFSDEIWNGWSLYLSDMYGYHGSEADKDFEYGKQFRYKKGDSITMILDLSQPEYQNGTLSFMMEAELVNDKQNEKVYSRILYDDLDINKQYRMAVSIQNYGTASDEISLLFR